MVRRRVLVLVAAVLAMFVAGAAGGGVAQHLSGGGFEDPQARLPELERDAQVSSVALGLERTGRIVTAAAALLAVVFLAFATSQVTFIKLFGLGLALAVILDATLIRAVLVPAFMRLAGNANWWAPAPLRRLHDRFGIAGSGDMEEPAPPPPRVTVVEAVARCMDAGAIAAGDPFLVATNLWTAVHGVTSLLIARPDFPWPDFDRLMGLIVDVQSKGLR